jgi:hypothetical protein
MLTGAAIDCVLTARCRSDAWIFCEHGGPVGEPVFILPVCSAKTSQTTFAAVLHERAGAFECAALSDYCTNEGHIIKG